MNSDDLLVQLKILSGGSVVMSTEQLARSLSMNPKVISRMRQEGRFPIAHKSIGSKIVYPIVTVASYLLNDSPDRRLENPYPVNIEPKRRKANRANPSVPDLSRKMLRTAFVSTLEAQQNNIAGLLLLFEKKALAKEMGETLMVNPCVERQSCPIKV